MELQETKDTIEDMEFQIGQCKMQKENQLAVLAGEVAYLNEHQVAHPPSPLIECDKPHQSQPAPAARVPHVERTPD